MEAVKEMESVEKIQAINKTSWIQRMKSADTIISGPLVNSHGL